MSEQNEAFVLAKEIKDKVDMLVGNYGGDVVKPLRDLEAMNTWIILKNHSSGTILLAMKMYLEGVIRTLNREKNK